ncbi:MAG: hypothetical protein AAB521_01195 [Patescibacteria group bacterium]
MPKKINADNKNNPEIISILNEVSQNFPARQNLLKEWSKLNSDRNVITYFSSFMHPAAMIDDGDRDTIEGILQGMDNTRELDLIISSPGGRPLSAERIINVCRTYSKGFRVIVPKLAKSAATMIAFGADSILLGESSELGPVDPQISYVDQTGKIVTRSAYAIVKGVEEILERIKNAGSGRVEGLLSLLPPVDQPFLEECKIAQELSKDIAIRYLKNTTFKNLPEKQKDKTDQKDQSIEEKIAKFLNPEETFSHGRPIMYKEAKNIGLNVELLKKEDERWNLLLKIYTRSNFVVSNSNIIKLVESPQSSFSASVPPMS